MNIVIDIITKFNPIHISNLKVVFFLFLKHFHDILVKRESLLLWVLRSSFSIHLRIIITQKESDGRKIIVYFTADRRIML